MKVTAPIFSLALLLLVYVPPLLSAQDPFGGDPFAKPPIADQTKGDAKKAEDGKEKEDAKPEPPQFATLEEALDYLDAALDELEEAAEFGSRQYKQIAQPLEDEYQRNDAIIQSQNSPDPELVKRQRIILLLLSELKRLGKSWGSSTSHIRLVGDTLRPFWKKRPPQELMRRMSQLQTRAHKISPNPFQGRSSFSLIPPGSKIEPARNDPTNPFGAELLNTQKVRVAKDLQLPLGYLFKLSYDGDDLVVDRDHWAAPFADKSMAEVTEDVKQLLGECGIPVPKRDDRFSRGLSANKTHVVLLFENLESYAERLSPGSGSSGGGGSNELLRKHFSRDKVEARLRTSPEDLEFNLRTGNDFVRIAESLQPDAPMLKLTLILDDAITNFDRRPDGSVRLAGVKGDQTFSASANSFAELKEKHPDAVNEYFFAELKRTGIIVPEGGGQAR